MGKQKQRYCVIGAGAAGICAAKYALQAGGEVVVFEQTDQIGGTWSYTDAVGKDKYGLDIACSMYDSLWTNLPKEIMGYADYTMPPQRRSYIHWSEVLQFLRDYARHFEVDKHTRFEHLVSDVRPYGSGQQWQVRVKDLKGNTHETLIFDYVLVCNGHYFDPKIPDYEGKDLFKGVQLHSHQYRKPDVLQNRNVLIIGAGPSGRDLVFAAAECAKTVYFSHHVPQKLKDAEFPANVVQVPDVARLHEADVEFVDGSRQSVDFILYCTGYHFNFPFLHKDCGIELDDDWVRPLYKQIININYPTMAFIGIPFLVCTTLMFDLQSRFIMKYYSGSRLLPSREEMMEDFEKEINDRWARGLQKRQAHMMGGEVQRVYYNDVAKTADIEPIPPVMINMHIASHRRKNEDLSGYRNDIFRAVDKENFEVEYVEELANRGK
ncbi:senecionine N-oxygenase-like isoform X2 [Ochlerotatus camptorhynchus]|uniref:senecionine N-oxygenase-like isoform X2 n=1 Tax=Ochlerotatus camptorhynchus TaxID=644619 RepID=UPI0031D52327